MSSRFLPYRTIALGSAMLVACLLSGVAALAQGASEEIVVGPFSHSAAGDAMPTQWQPLRFRNIERQTSYRLVEDEGRVAVRADAHDAASGLVRDVRIDPRAYPVVEWRWKVLNVLRGADVRTKAGDDYPARLYVTFAYDPARVGLLERAKFEAVKLFYGRYPPGGALSYLWASRAPVGTRVPNAYTDRVQMIVVESGPERLGQWVVERANVYDDFRRAFGFEPPPVTGVAIMTDTDNTGEDASAFYGDIVFRGRAEGAAAGTARSGPGD
jgi:hypothetical protein